ncbi:MAG TPA: phosphate ABC transporter substrate-binding protein [Ktedonobacteraceae bacterium]|nr:phosphate ABC transporter substrate-binding protein [Ktedonobacteraceae bacterium]
MVLFDQQPRSSSSQYSDLMMKQKITETIQKERFILKDKIVIQKFMCLFKVSDSWKRIIRISPVALILVGLLTGCTSPQTTQDNLQGKLQIVGSTALQPLAQDAATLFEKDHPQVKITVGGHGSGFGLGAVTNHQTDIGDSDIYANPALYPDPNLTDHIICVIPFTMVVGPGVNITSLTQQQIIDIFSTGKLKNWHQLGGPNLPIVPIVRPNTSGTRATFRKYILLGGDEKGTLLQTDSSQSVRDKVVQTPGSIGYLALSVVDKTLHPIAINGEAATPGNIEAGHYSFWSYEHMYTMGDNNLVVSAFLDFMLSSAIQELAQQHSYIPIAQMKLPTSGTSPNKTNGTAWINPQKSEGSFREKI